MQFRDRREAGKILAKALLKHVSEPGLAILALPRGGVPVAFEVAKALNASLDVFIVRKLGVPGHEELAMGAIASGGIRVLDESVTNYLNISSRIIDAVAKREEMEMKRRESIYRHGKSKLDVKGKIIILVDDGLATGSTMRAAITALQKQNPQRLIAAVPVASPSTCELLSKDIDEMICLTTPEPFHAVGDWYDDFSQTTDEEVRTLLAEANQGRSTLLGSPNKETKVHRGVTHEASEL